MPGARSARMVMAIVAVVIVRPSSSACIATPPGRH